MIAWIKSAHFFPTLIIIMFILAAGRYALSTDWAKTGYWISAAALNVFILMMEGK